MSMHPRPWPDVPEETAVLARRVMRKGNLAMRIRDELGPVYDDERFAAAFGARGRPGISPGQLMVATVLQFSENLTDRQAAEAVRDRISWKYALGLPLRDTGFDASVLSEFRGRLLAGGLERLALDALLQRLAGLGLLPGGGRARTDSTHVLASVRTLNRLELAGETLRAALEALAAAAPDWLAPYIFYHSDVNMFRHTRMGEPMNTRLTYALALAAGIGIAGSAQSQSMPETIGAFEYMNSCAACHGANGKGDGTIAPYLNVALPDLTKLQANNGGVFPVTRVFQIIEGGRHFTPENHPEVLAGAILDLCDEVRHASRDQPGTTA